MSTAAKLIAIAEAEVGYLEKASNSQLDSKTANAGSKNYTKYGAWYAGGILQAQAWCAMFVSWCANQAEIATSIIPLHASCTVGINWFKNNGAWKARSGYTPKVGDIIYFSNSSGSPAHVGIVYKVDGSKVYTIEGNTSGGSTVIANGGGVCKKSYALSYSRILGYGVPTYSGAATISATAATASAVATLSQTDGIKEFQTWLNKNYSSKLTVDGAFGTKTKTAAIKAMQKAIGVTADGAWGAKSKATCSVVKKGGTGNKVYILQGVLFCRGYTKSGFDGTFGANTESDVKSFQKAKGLTADGQAGKDTFTKLFA